MAHNFFREDEIESVFAKTFLTGYKYQTKNTLEPKINYFQIDDKKTNDINNFETIYTLSDIHADYRKFLKILLDCKIIKYNDDDKYRKKIYSDNIYDPDLILNVEWANPKTLLVICGDLLDGKRNSSVDDKRGYFEILLLVFIFNLKFKAKENKSDIKIIQGNHDFFYKEYGLKYVHDQAVRFFGPHALTNRPKILSPFFNKCGLNEFHITCSNKKVISFVHGGFHNNRGILDPNEFVWNRTYFDVFQDEKLSAILGNKEMTTTYIVGHSPTWNLLKTFNDDRLSHSHVKTHAKNNCRHFEIDSNGKQKEKGENGCIYPRCFLKGTNTPRIILVDTGLSEAFQSKSLFQTKKIQNITEILKIKVLLQDGEECPKLEFYRVRHNNDDNSFSEELIENPDDIENRDDTTNLENRDGIENRDGTTNPTNLGGTKKKRKKSNKKPNKKTERRIKKCSRHLKK